MKARRLARINTHLPPLAGRSARRQAATHQAPAPALPASAGPAVLSVRDLHVRRGGAEVLRGVGLQLHRGEVCALMGHSGGGKTTLLRTILALVPFAAGSVDLDGLSLSPGVSRVPAGLRRKVGMVFQQHHLFEHLSALDNVMLAQVHVLGLGRAEAEARSRRLLAELGIAGRAGALPRELSGGEAQRVAIARALAMDPPLLLLDEPTASLDPCRRDELGALLRRLAAQGRTLLCSTHDEDFAREHAHRVVVLEDGRVRAS